MQSSWNQWGGGVNTGVGNYATNYPGAIQPAVNNFTSIPSANPFSIPATSALNTSAAAPAISSQYAVGNNLYGQPAQQQQWQQWEQWQQQYAQWHQQYGDKYQGPTPGILPTSGSFTSVPPLPSSAPVQPPPPDSVPPPSEKSSDSTKRPPTDSGGKEETKKLKLGKGSKSESVEDLIEQEKTFDAQFKTWESSFLKWKEQNANHPDKTQYKEYEAKWETFREQLLQKREQLRKKRETKEAEIAAAAAAAKEAALATSNVSTLTQPPSFNSTMMNANNPYASMYTMPGVYQPQDMTSGNYVSGYSMYNLPPPSNVSQMPGMPPMGQDPQNVQKPGEGPKSTQSLEFLSAASSNMKSIPGLDLAGAGGADKNLQNAPFSSNIPSNSSLFSYSQDVTKPLHTSDDKPFNFPAPQSQSNFAPNDGGRQYGRGQSGGFNSFDQPFRKTTRFSQYDGPPPQGGPNQMDRNAPPFDDRFGGGNFNREADSNFSNDRFSRGGRQNDYRDEPTDRGANKFGNSSYTPNLSSDKFAKYLEDEYDDSRFRDPEPSNENQQFNNKFNYQNRDNQFGRGGFNNRENFGGRSDGNSFGFNSDRGRGGFDRSRGGQFDRSKPESRFDSFGRGGAKNNQFGGRNTQDVANEGFERGGNEFNRGPNDFGRGGNDFGRGGNDFNRGGNDFNRGGNDFNRGGNDFNRGGNDFNRGGNDFNRGGNDFNRGGNDSNRGGNDFFNNRETNDLNRGAADSKPTESSKPVSLLDLPLMKPPEPLETMLASTEKPEVPKQPDNNFNSFSAKNNRFPFARNESDQNFYSNKEVSAPPANTKPPLNSSVPKEVPKPIVVEDPIPQNVQPEVIQNFTPSCIFEYDHISRNNDSTGGFFEPIFVFDYSHGKKTKSDFVKDSVTPLADINKLNKVDESPWAGGSWDATQKTAKKEEPLPPRNRNKFPDALDLFKTVSHEKTDVTQNDSSKKDNTFKPLIPEKSEENRRFNNARKDDDMFAEDFVEKHTVVLINDILCSPGRQARPAKIVIIMRGPPGSGKTYTAKLIKDKEVEMGGNPPRILSLDDYFSVENDVQTTDPATGKTITKKEMQYEYDAALEPSYLESFLKSFKKNISDGFFPFIIVDCINDKLKHYEEMYTFAKSKGFQVYICEMDLDLSVCKTRNIHKREETDISKIISNWEKTPFSQTLLDVKSLTQSEAVTKMDVTTEEPSAKPENADPSAEDKKDEKEPSAAETKTEDEKEESESSKEKETNSTESAKSEPAAPASKTGFSYPRRARATFRGTPRMLRPPGMPPAFQERRGFGGPTWRRGWPSRR